MKKILLCAVLSVVCVCAYGEETKEYACAAPRPTGAVENRACIGKRVGDICTAPNAKTANSGKCFRNGTEVSCPAYDCNPGSSLLLWDNKVGSTKNRYPSVQEFLDSGKVINYGYCAQDSFWKKYCGKLDCTCENAHEEKCHFKNFDYTITKGQTTYNTKAYYGKIPCVCAAGTMPTKISCKYKWSGKITCNGKVHDLNDAEAVLDEEQCYSIIDETTGEIDGTKAKALLDSLIRGSAEDLKQLFPGYCGGESTVGGGTVGSVTVENQQLIDAQSTIKLFKERAKKEASVWKTAEGKFNTTRLASDITAGVVLGTVGGVVTGNIIKKNQVKKGFEALHCTVGGQKVADWGDEFSVGLRR